MAERSNAPVSRSGIRKDARVRIPLLALLIIKNIDDLSNLTPSLTLQDCVVGLQSSPSS
jgi:hypothetical protein